VRPTSRSTSTARPIWVSRASIQVQEARVEQRLGAARSRVRALPTRPRGSRDGDIERLEDLAGKTVATEFPNITEDFFADTGVEPDIVEVSGATELTPHVEMADAIVDITSTGTTLKMNRLAIVDEVLSSSVRLFGRDDVLDEPKIDEVRTALSSVKQAEGKRYLMMNVPRDRLEDVRDVIPGLGGPTIMDIADENDDEATVAVHAVVDERNVFETITEVKNAGASDILVTEIERLIE